MYLPYFIKEMYIKLQLYCLQFKKSENMLSLNLDFITFWCLILHGISKNKKEGL